jgi:hypothetical protein
VRGGNSCDLVTNPVLVVAVAQACSIIADRRLSAKKAARMRAASIRVAELIVRAEADMHPVPTPPAPALIEAVPPPSAPVVVVRRRRQYVRRWWPAGAVLLLVVVALLVSG